MADFPYTTRDLLEVVQGPKFKAPSYFRDTFFGNVRISRAKEIMFDKLPNGDRAVAPYINRRVGGKRIELQGYSTEMYTPPVVGNSFVVTPEDGFLRAPGKTEYEATGSDTFLDYQIKDGLTRIENMISRREELMCAQALINGHIEVKGEGVEDDIQYWSQLDTAEQPVLNLGTKWTESTSALQVMKDLSAAADVIVERCGQAPTRLICGARVYQTLLAILGESKVLDIRNANLGSVAPADRGAGIRYLGYLPEPGVEIVCYSGRYAGADGNVAKLIPDDTCVLVASNLDTVMAYGAMAVGWEASGVPAIVTGTRFAFERQHDSLEQGRAIYLHSCPLPILQSTNGFLVIKAVQQ